MKTYAALGVTLLMSACGGTSIGLDDSVTRASLADYNIQSVPVDTNQDASFGSILNNLRIDNGGTAVTYDARLDQAAQAHAEDMVARNFFDHTNPDGLTEEDRIRATGYDAQNFGENIAGRQQTEGEALVTWINSPEHNRLLNAGTVDDFGLGMAGTGSDRRWVLVMARER